MHMIIKKCEMCGINYKDCEFYLENTNVKDELTLYKYLCCHGNYFKKFDENLKKNLANTCRFPNQPWHQ